MAGRPFKEGLDYFELDCTRNDKLKLIEAEFGLKGFAVIVKLYQKIYSEKGYYCEWNMDVSLLFAGENLLNSGDTYNLINEIVAASIRRNIFSGTLFKEYGILTSKRIQEQYLRAVSKREKVVMKKEYLLISVPINSINVVINSISDGINSISDVGNSQRREEKSREENIPVSKDTVCRTDVQRAVEEWNMLEQYGIKKISRITSGTQRYERLQARIRQHGIDEVLYAIGKVAQSGFLQGRSGNAKQWVITFDWFVLPNNFPKVLDGNYDDKLATTVTENGDMRQILENVGMKYREDDNEV